MDSGSGSARRAKFNLNFQVIGAPPVPGSSSLPAVSSHTVMYVYTVQLYTSDSRLKLVRIPRARGVRVRRARDRTGPATVSATPSAPRSSVPAADRESVPKLANPR